MGLTLTYRLQNDGTADLLLGGQKVLSTGWGVDLDYISNSGVEITGDSVRTSTQRGAFRMDFRASQIGFSVTAQTCMEEAPRFVYPVYQAAVTGLEGFYRQGFGLGGPSGYLSAGQLRENQIAYSFGMTVLKFPQGYLGIYAKDATRYIQRCEIQADHVKDGVFWFADKEEKVFRFSAGFQIENTSGELNLPELCFTCGESLQELLDRMTVEIAGAYQPPVKEEPAYHWCSWYYYYNNFDLRQLQEFLEGLGKLEKPVPIKYVQIDAGYFPSAGDWLDCNTLWPGGMKAAFDLIRSYGYKPGIWIGPFMAGCRSRLFAEHPDWMLKKTDGSYVTEWRLYNEQKVWGYQDEEYYVLDTSNPGAMAYLGKVFQTLREWGAEFFKTDFMLWGIQDSATVRRHTPGKTTVEHYRDLMATIKQAISGAWWLGCIAPYLPSLGYVNGMRIAGDVGAQWLDEGCGPAEMIRQAVGDNHLNGRFWQNDPDALIIRDKHVFLTEKEITAISLFQALSGGMVYTSDPLGDIGKERVNLFRFVEPKAVVRPEYPLLEESGPVVTLHHERNGYHWLFFLNTSHTAQTLCHSVEKLTGEKALFLTRWQGGQAAVKQEELVLTVEPHSCALYFGSAAAPLKQPETLWQFADDFQERNDVLSGESD